MSVTKGRRQPFPTCGHRGYGKICHRCAQAEELEGRARKMRLDAHESKKSQKGGKDNEKPLLQADGLDAEAKRLRTAPRIGAQAPVLP